MGLPWKTIIAAMAAGIGMVLVGPHVPGSPIACMNAHPACHTNAQMAWMCGLVLGVPLLILNVWGTRGPIVGRYEKSTGAGAVIAAALIVFADLARHAQVVAAAAQMRMPASHYLVVVFCGLTLVAGAVVYVAASIAGRWAA
jgi:hypothetical protein